MAARIVLDPGHGGDQPCPGADSPKGARGASGLWEKVYTLDVARRARDILACSGVQAVLTRQDDICRGIAERRAVAEGLGWPLLSIHFNSAPAQGAHGTEAFWWSGNAYSDESQRLAEAVVQAIVARLGTRRRGVFDRGDLGVLKARVPAALIEVGFINNPEEEARLVGTAAARHQTALAIAEGVGAHLGVEVRPCPPNWPLIIGVTTLAGFALSKGWTRFGAGAASQRRTL